MNNIFIIGNGFDLAHGLPTRYDDFLLYFFKKNINKENPLVLIEVYAKHDVFIGQCNSDKKDLMHELQKANTINEFTSLLTRKHESLNTHFDYKSKFLQNLINFYNERKWVDIEYSFFRYLVNVFKSSLDQPVQHTRIRNANNDLEYLKCELINYLKSIEKEKSELFKIDQTIKKRLISIRLSENENNRSQKNLFLNFNYTSLIELYKRSTSNDTVINIHGNTDDKMEDIIFGYGDEMDPMIQEIEFTNEDIYLQNLKTFGYLKSEKRIKLDSFIELNEFNAIIVGHSCGISDRLLLSYIFNHINCKKIKVLYYKESEVKNDFTEKIMNIYRHFNSQNKDLLWKKVENYLESKPLKEP